MEAAFPVPPWEPDEARADCSLCSSEFTLTSRRHHCRGCGRLVCESCSTHRLKFPSHFGCGQEPQRCCQMCMDQRYSLYFRATENDVEAVKILVMNGLNSEAQIGFPALHRAIERGNVEAARLMLEAGVSTASCDTDGTTALHMAAWNGYLGCIRALMEYGASIDVQDNRGQTPLHVAVKGEQTAAVQCLLTARASPLVTDRVLQSPLHLACMSRDPLLVHFLLVAKADPEMQDKRGQRAEELDAEGAMAEALNSLRTETAR